MGKSGSVLLAIGAALFTLSAVPSSAIELAGSGSAVAAKNGAESVTSRVREQLVGKWLGSFNGVDFTVEYTESHFCLTGTDPSPYSLDGYEMTTTFLGEVHVSVLAFPNVDTMVQTEKKSGAQIVLKRMT